MQIETFDLPDFWASALINGDTSGLTDPRLGGKGLVEAELLSMMPLADRISILSGGETLAKYVDGPTLEEEAIREKAAARGFVFA